MSLWKKLNKVMKLVLMDVMVICLLFGCACSTGNADMSANEKEAAGWAEKQLKKMSLEKKVAQLITADITGVYLPEDDPRYQKWIELAGEYGIGGFVLYKGTPFNVASLLNRLQEVAEIPLLISADFEGGAGQQVSGASEFPANMGFMAADDPDLMYRAAKVMAEEGRAMGIHLSYTPVCDITVDPANPQESVRSFGGDPKKIRKLIGAYIKGYHEAGMLTTAKHFPGRGDMRPFPAYPGFTYIEKSEVELLKNEFLGFKNAIEEGVDFIMTEHIAVPSVTDGSDLPASIEPKLTREVIRESLGFKGIITTDDLWYDHVVERFGAEEVVIRALEAGHDVILKPRDPVAAVRAVADAVNSGRLSMQQIDRSVYKVLYTKALLGLHKNKFVDERRVGEIVGTTAHKEIIAEVADRSLTMLKNDNVLPLTNPGKMNVVNVIFTKNVNNACIEDLKSKISLVFGKVQNFIVLAGSDGEENSMIKKAAAGSDLVILSFFVQRERHGDPVPLGNEGLSLINMLITGKPRAVIGMSYGNPYVINKIKDIPVFIVGYGEGGWYGNQAVYVDSFMKVLKSELSPEGKLPVRVNDRLDIGFGLTL
jgi:beta-N-acetylhexosaminidase